MINFQNPTSEFSRELNADLLTQTALVLKLKKSNIKYRIDVTMKHLLKEYFTQGNSKVEVIKKYESIIADLLKEYDKIEFSKNLLMELWS